MEAELKSHLLTRSQAENDICSNFDHMVDESVVNQVESGKYYANYPGWNFYATVLHDGKDFVAFVKQYGDISSRETADTFLELKSKICDKYGAD